MSVLKHTKEHNQLGIIDAGAWPYGHYQSYLTGGQGYYMQSPVAGEIIASDIIFSTKGVILPFISPKEGGQIEMVTTQTRNNGASTSTEMIFAIYDARTLVRLGKGRTTIVAGADDYIHADISNAPIIVPKYAYLAYGFEGGSNTVIPKVENQFYPGWQAAVDPIDVSAFFSNISYSGAYDEFPDPMIVSGGGTGAVKEQPWCAMRWRQPSDALIVAVGDVATVSVSKNGFHSNDGTWDVTQHHSDRNGVDALFSDAVIAGGALTGITIIGGGTKYTVGEVITLELAAGAGEIVKSQITVDSIT